MHTYISECSVKHRLFQEISQLCILLVVNEKFRISFYEICNFGVVQGEWWWAFSSEVKKRSGL